MKKILNARIFSGEVFASKRESMGEWVSGYVPGLGLSPSRQEKRTKETEKEKEPSCLLVDRRSFLSMPVYGCGIRWLAFPMYIFPHAFVGNFPVSLKKNVCFGIKIVSNHGSMKGGNIR